MLRKSLIYRFFQLTLLTTFFIGILWLTNTFYEAHLRKQNDKRLYKTLWFERQEQVKQAFKRSWDAYEKDAWGYDLYHPVSHNGSNLVGIGVGFTIVDSLDTLLIMKLDEEYKKAREWVATKLDFNQDSSAQIFEITIRVLGGLLSAYHLSGNDKLYLEKSKDLGDRLMASFSTPSAVLPYLFVNLRSGSGTLDFIGLAEAGTLNLEFRYLSHLTGDEKYWRAAEKIIFHIDGLEKLDGLCPLRLNVTSGEFDSPWIRVGGNGDSYYEYLLKSYIQTAGTEPIYRRLWNEAVFGIKKHLIAYSLPNNRLHFGEIVQYPRDLTNNHVMDHLTCFMGGALALGSITNPQNPKSRLTDNEDFKVAVELTETCAQLYFFTATNIAPEIVKFEMSSRIKPDFDILPGQTHNQLRPETIESFYYLWKITGDLKYREWGWTIFEAFEKYAKLEDGAYFELQDVRNVTSAKRDKMESFWLTETLKYFYLLFDDPDNDRFPFDKFVFTTEAHPFPIFKPTSEVRGDGWNRE
ncbi:hypothetical protein G9A89_013358 [Geosiphon pyriformis]|nr:hypothetical protein G9A89_013358 [Geosiphon pyriformis]